MGQCVHRTFRRPRPRGRLPRDAGVVVRVNLLPSAKVSGETSTVVAVERQIARRTLAWASSKVGKDRSECYLVCHVDEVQPSTGLPLADQEAEYVRHVLSDMGASE